MAVISRTAVFNWLSVLASEFVAGLLTLPPANAETSDEFGKQFYSLRDSRHR